MNYDIELYSIIIPVVLEIITLYHLCLHVYFRVYDCFIFFLAPEKPEKR